MTIACLVVVLGELPHNGDAKGKLKATAATTTLFGSVGENELECSPHIVGLIEVLSEFRSTAETRV